ncbi:hypothetical protein F8M41_019780 [Gigaspora margarita]|uniref:Uncharacterized protein n=1 Tax=Gigaspora margarita TaxID=4874 RepID=A0A8H4AJH8_GIGMA|nr:hypothetical protein F8M41_019780 [Gigaspora margarita]
MSPKNDYPLKLSGEELNGKEKKLHRLAGKYFETYQKWNINSFLDYLNDKGCSHKFPLIVKKEIFMSWLEKKLECGKINAQVYLSLLRETKKKNSEAISFRSLIKTESRLVIILILMITLSKTLQERPKKLCALRTFHYMTSPVTDTFIKLKTKNRVIYTKLEERKAWADV